jgi:hypothetical protein
MKKRVGYALAFATLFLATAVGSAHAAGQALGYSCSGEDVIGRPFMPPMVPQKVVSRQALFLKRAGFDTTFHVGMEFGLDDGSRVLSVPSSSMWISKASTSQLLQLAAPGPAAVPSPSQPYPALLRLPPDFAFAPCGVPPHEHCFETRPLGSRLPNDVGSRVVQRWDVAGPQQLYRGNVSYRSFVETFVYESSNQTYFLDSFGWIVPIPDKSASSVLTGLRAVPSVDMTSLTSIVAGVQSGAGKYILLPCQDGEGSCRHALPAGTVVNATVSDDLIIQSVDELDFVRAKAAHPIGFVYHVRSGQAYLQVGLTMTAFAGRDVGAVMRSVAALGDTKPLAEYKSDPSSWQLASTRCSDE